MAESGALTARQARFVAALLTAVSISEAASLAHIGERSAWRYLAEPEVLAELSRRQDAILGAAAAGLAGDVSQAREVLRAVMGDKLAPVGARVSAAGKVLDSAMRLVELAALARRVADLERELGEDGIVT